MTSRDYPPEAYHQQGEPENGVIRVVCSDWIGFSKFVNRALINVPNAVFRGHADSRWKLIPTIGRAIEKLDLPGDESRVSFQRSMLITKHLDDFKYAIRGRRGPSPHPLQDDDDIWALGQHYGLATPLLDWTESPFVAAYFAFASEETVDTEYATVFALSRFLVDSKLSDLRAEGIDVSDEARFVRPFVDDNARLINQRGMFTISGRELCLRDWVVSRFSGEGDGNPLIEVLIPRSERLLALRSLNRMNINALTLFPDIYGASEFCNKKLADKLY